MAEHDPAGGKVAIVGAGAVGSTLAYACLMRGSAREVVLHDLDKTLVEAQALDIAHGIQFTPMGSVAGSDDVAVCAGADVVVVTAGAKQRPGQSRLELAGASIDIARAILPPLLDVAPDAVYVIVSNPVDVVTYAAQRITGLPAGRLFGSGTVLDSSRLRYLVAQRCGVAVQNVHAYIAGEHGDSEVPLWSSAVIGAVPLLEWDAHDGAGSALDAAARAEIEEEVVSAAYRIIAGKGSTNFAVGLAVVRIVEAVLRDERRVMPVSSLLEDYLGMSDVCMSVPSVVGRHGVERRLVPAVTRPELARLQRSAASIREVLAHHGF